MTIIAQRKPVEPDAEDLSRAIASWQLVERHRAGDREAFAEIYKRYRIIVWRFIYLRCSHVPTVEDLVQDVFVNALRRLDKYEWQGRDLGAWLVTIARNRLSDHYKSGRYRLEVAGGDLLDADRVDDSREGQPESALDQMVNASMLSILGQLSPEQRECLELRFLRGYSVSETAAVMGKNDGSVKALQYRAVRAMARLGAESGLLTEDMLG
ncbi:sigma-70 family RNA polymerase sigma factor [Actinoplanes sp. TBRC 11911]|uniref:sigma-70 family RNA polymerase sigma factor n=1 Tax=Actinoplanes sp. TBRC 11911 TaxID=2729386 RepID=UPI00145F40A8|nr:sigma-70 family RNA polymerase sigma factor [Actinoplanes sp. TBRC 11911]NMO51988.1 sigma-70 family RNA polymerase sigma factor [Actinoplanes sp. TBRC 11911]